MTTDIFKPKTKLEVLNILHNIKCKFKHITINQEYEFIKYFNEEIPISYLPFLRQCKIQLKEKHNIILGDNIFYFKIKHTSLWLNSHVYQSNVNVNISPARKINELENIRNGTNFTISNLEQLDIIIEFLKDK